MQQQKLMGQKIVVTGSSRGIGAGITKALAAMGAQVAITYSSSQAAAEQVLSGLPGEGHICVKLNTTSETEVQSAFTEIMDKLGGITGLVNNAGITADGLLLRMKLADFEKVVQTNLTGTFLCTKQVLKPMIKAKGGSIVNISSVVAQMGNPGQANYVASKAGIEGFTRSVAKEVASRNIRVNCIAPGYIGTAMTDDLTDAQKTAMTDNIPLNRIGHVEDIANAVAFLLSSDSSYITGQILSVNGGLYM